MISTKISNLFFWLAAFLLSGCLVLAFIDPTFRPIFGEIVKAVVSGIFQGLITKV